MFRRIIIRLISAALLVLAAVLGLEYALEVRDLHKYSADQTFAELGTARVRYKLAGADHPGATVVFLSGLRGSIEQSEQLQSALAQAVPTLAYDRGGYGFSRGSSAHSAWDQAGELAALLDALHIKGPVVLVPYSFSGDLARVFAGRFPERTAAVYMLEPSLPSIYEQTPPWHSPRRSYVRPTLRDLIASSLGVIRLKQRLASWQGPASPVEQRADAILASRAHYWALTREWYALADSTRQTEEAPVPPALPLWIAYVRHSPADEVNSTSIRLYGEFVARSTRGRLVELTGVKHDDLLKAGPAFVQIVAGITQLAQGQTG